MSGDISRAARDPKLQTVSQTMARLDISGLPRNYELVHEALAGMDATLAREIAALPTSPQQDVLDEIGLRYQLPGFVALAMPKSRDQEIRILADLRKKMASGVEQKQGFTRVLEAIARSLREDNNAGPEDILAEIEFLSVSLSDTVVAETELETALKVAADRLIRAEREHSAARAITLRDRMTSLPNYAAFAERLETLYQADGRDGALFLVSIADLAELSRTYGEPAANRIVKKIASIFRKAIKKHDFLARTGKGEFAFLFRDVTSDSVQPIAERLLTSLADNLTFAASGGRNTVRLSIGVSLMADAFSPQQLRQQAASAQESAQANPRLTVVLFGETAKRAM